MAEAVIGQEQGGVAQQLKDFVAGAAGGVAQVLVGQPFDIVKVRLQTSTTYPDALTAARTIYAHEGALAFYKGTLLPLIGIGACVSIQFGAFHEARRRLEAFNATKLHSTSELSYAQYYAAGAFAGVANTVISAPVEHVRIRLQTQPTGSRKLYSGPLDCVRQLFTQGGIFRGLYRGGSATLVREAQAYGSWFLAFEYMMNTDAARNKIERKEIPTYKTAFYGGLAGEALWLSSYPFDVVKSKMQSDGFGPKMKYKSMSDCVQQTFKEEGLAGFWKGIRPTLVRAIPVSASTFVAVEMTIKAIS